jgi:polar amino acid transport system permease protein
MIATLLGLAPSHWDALIKGLTWTVFLSLVGFFAGGLLGFGVALARISKSAVLRRGALVYVNLIQGTPLLVLMFVLYFGLPILGFDMPPIAAACIAMTLFSAAYLGEIWRGCLQAVPKTQWEAADCLALTGAQRMGLVILPQALRIATPPTVGFMVQIVKNTSIASVIGMAEMTYIGKLINNATFQPFRVYLVIAGLYFLLCYPLSWLSRRLEKKLNVAHH